MAASNASVSRLFSADGWSGEDLRKSVFAVCLKEGLRENVAEDKVMVCVCVCVGGMEVNSLV